MAARKTTSSTATTQAAPDAVAVDGVGPDAEAATPAPTDVTPETAGADTREDARAAALAALAAGAQPAPPEGEDVRPEPPLDVEAHPEDQDVDAGGDARRVGGTHRHGSRWRGVLRSDHHRDRNVHRSAVTVGHRDLEGIRRRTAEARSMLGTRVRGVYI